jgi:uncharacterized membrane protein YuzA (DUF378 family)
MRKEKTLLIIGLWVMIIPFSGFPSNWRAIIFIITGICIVYLAYLFYGEARARLNKIDKETKIFVDNIEN